MYIQPKELSFQTSWTSHYPKNSSRISVLHSNWDSLEEGFQWPWLPSDLPETSTEVLDERESLGPKHAQSLHCHWNKMMARVEVGVLGNLHVFSPLCHSSSLSGGMWYIRWGICVWACDIPHQYLTPLPWYNGDPIRAISVRLIYAWWFRTGGDFVKDRWMMSLMAAWHGWRPSLQRQLRPWVASGIELCCTTQYCYILISCDSSTM